MKPFKAEFFRAGNDDGVYAIAFHESAKLPDDGPYLAIQWGAESEGEDGWYIEAMDPEEECAYGHYAIQSAELTPTSFRIRWGPGVEESVEITFDADATKFSELARITRIMIPKAQVTDAN
jgi:hypothetical protein